MGLNVFSLFTATAEAVANKYELSFTVIGGHWKQSDGT